MRQHPPHIFSQKTQQLILNRRQMDLLIPDKHTTGCIIDLQIPVHEDRVVLHAPAALIHSPAKACPQPCQQLLHTERFRQIIICPRIQCAYLIRVLAPGTYHDDRYI